MSVCDLPVLSSVCSSAGEAAASLVSAPFDWLADGVGHLAGWLFESVWTLFATTTAVDLTSGTYLRVYNIVFGIAVFLMLAMFLIQLISGMVHRDPGALSTAAAGLGRAILGSFLVVTLAATALQIVDQLCVGIVQATGTTLDEMGVRIAALGATFATVSALVPGAGALLAIFLGSMAIGAALSVWCSLLLRKCLLLVAIVLAPIALSGQTWRATRSWTSRWATFVIALIASKLVVVVVFLVAVNQMSAPIDLDLASISEPVSGVALMLIAAFAPYLVYKLIAFVGFDLHQVMSSEAEARGAIDRPIPMPTAGGVRTILGAGRAPAGGASDASPSDSGPTLATTTPAPGGASTGAEAGAGGALGGAGASGAAGAGESATAGAAGGAAAAGPVGLAIAAGAVAVEEAAHAGPTLGRALSQQAEQIAEQPASQSSPPQPGADPVLPPRSPSAPTGGPPATPGQVDDAPTPRQTPEP